MKRPEAHFPFEHFIELSLSRLPRVLGQSEDELPSALRRQLGSFVAESLSSDTLRTLSDGENLHGLFAFVRSDIGPLGVPSLTCRVEGALLNDPLVQKWLSVQIEDLKSTIDQSFELLLPESLSFLLPTLEHHGFYEDLAVSYGYCETALKMLQAKYGGDLDFAAVGLKVEHLTKEEDAHSVMRLLRDEFHINPAYRWFNNNPDYLTKRQEALIRGISQPDVLSYILRNAQNEIVGFFGGVIKQADLLWGPNAGIEFFFDPSIRGKGMVKRAYVHVLNELSKREINVFLGGTNQPAIKHLNQIMGRVTFARVIRFLA